ncbi:MAG: peptidoglycan-binding domain-containing protein [Paracoccaceae bacterium]
MSNARSLYLNTAIVLAVTIGFPGIGATQDRVQGPIISQLITASLQRCFLAPKDGVLADDTVDMVVMLNAQGDIDGLPEVQKDGDLSIAERKLMKSATEALLACTPVVTEAGEEAVEGDFTLTATISGLKVSNVAAAFATLENPVQSREIIHETSIDDVDDVVEAVEASETSDDSTPPEEAENDNDTDAEDTNTTLNEGTEETEDAMEMSRKQRTVIQRRLVLLGYDPRGVDGVFGPGSRAAIEKWQGENELPTSGYFNENQVEFLNVMSEAAYSKWRNRPRQYYDRNGCLREASGKIIEGRSFGCDMNAAGQSLGLSK